MYLIHFVESGASKCH